MTVVPIDTGKITDADAELKVFFLDHDPTILTLLLILVRFDLFVSFSALLCDLLKVIFHVERYSSIKGLLIGRQTL